MSVDGIVQGLLLGGLYVAAALGLSITFGVMRLVNLAHGELVVLGAYLAALVTGLLGVDPLISLVIVLPLAFIAGMGLQRFVLTRLLQKDQNTALVATFGLALVLQSVFLATSGPETRTLPTAYATQSIEILGVQLRVVQLVACGVGLLAALCVHLLLRRTTWGRSVRAAAADPVTARVLGVDVDRVYAQTFGLAAAVAALGGVLIGMSLSFTPTSGGAWTVQAFAVVVLGGIGSIPGAVVGGMLLGLVQAVSGQLIGGQYTDFVVYVAFFLMLALRPAGLLRRRVSGA